MVAGAALVVVLVAALVAPTVLVIADALFLSCCFCVVASAADVALSANFPKNDLVLTKSNDPALPGHFYMSDLYTCRFCISSLSFLKEAQSNKAR